MTLVDTQYTILTPFSHFMNLTLIPTLLSFSRNGMIFSVLLALKVERLMSEGLKDHRDRDGGYQSNRNQNNGESSRANVMGDRSSDHTITNPSPNVKKAGKKYGLSRPQGDTWAKRIADNIEADKTAAKNMGEKSSASSSSSSSSAAAINSKNIDLLAIAQDVIDARALLSKVKITNTTYLPTNLPTYLPTYLLIVYSSYILIIYTLLLNLTLTYSPTQL